MAYYRRTASTPAIISWSSSGGFFENEPWVVRSLSMLSTLQIALEPDPRAGGRVQPVGSRPISKRPWPSSAPIGIRAVSESNRRMIQRSAKEYAQHLVRQPIDSERHLRILKASWIPEAKESEDE